MDPSRRAKVFSERRLSRASDQRRRQPESRPASISSTGRPSVRSALGRLTNDPYANNASRALTQRDDAHCGRQAGLPHSRAAAGQPKHRERAALRCARSRRAPMRAMSRSSRARAASSPARS